MRWAPFKPLHSGLYVCMNNAPVYPVLFLHTGTGAKLIDTFTIPACVECRRRDAALSRSAR